MISGYWMNYHWLEKQKIQANKARFREASHQQESPSEYVIQKLELIGLVYSYTNSENIQSIMEEVPDLWASILNPQYLKSIMEFQNVVTSVKLQNSCRGLYKLVQAGKSCTSQKVTSPTS
jgi:hypothetical protein